MKKGSGLNKGLDSLIGDMDISELTESPKKNNENLKELPIDLIQRGKYQPRRDIEPEALEELASSIKTHGVMQPIIVRLIAEDRYEIIAGERRWRATQLAGIDKIPVIIKNVSDEVAVAMALIENIQRENLNPMEEAYALKRLQTEFELTQQEVANAVGKPRATIANLLRLMNLQSDVQTMLERGDIEVGHAKALLGLSGAEQSQAARQVVGKGMTVRQTEALVKNIIEGVGKPKGKEAKSTDMRRLEQDLSEKLGAAVAVQHGKNNKGKLIIRYSSLDELDGILAHIQR